MPPHTPLKISEQRGQQHSSPDRRSLAVCIVVAVGIFLRLASAAVGDNYDMQSWWIASDAFRSGEPIYAATHRYNYGPVWWWIIGALRSPNSALWTDTIAHLHLLMSALLSATDLGLAAILYRRVSPWVAAAFFLNPISIAVSGYHVQFDNLAILIGLVSWTLFLRASGSRMIIVAGAALGVSLSTKHIFSIFLAWLPFLTSARTLRERSIYGGIAVSLFALSFTPWLTHEAALAGIRTNVLGYVSTEGHSLTSDLALALGSVAPRTLFLLATILVGCLIARRSRLHRHAPYLYLIALTALSSGMARNYLAVPVVSIFLFYRCRFSAIYLVVASLAFITVNQALGVTEVIAPALSSPLVTYELIQLSLLALLLDVYWHGDRTSY